MLMVNEVNFKTHRQNIIDGWSRQQFIGVKIALVLIFPLLITVINIITGLFFGFIQIRAFSMDGTSFILYIFIQALAYLFFALMLAVLFRRSGLAIIIFFLYGIIFEWLVSALTNFQFKLSPAGYFLPLQASRCIDPDSIWQESDFTPIALTRAFSSLRCLPILRCMCFSQERNF